MLAINWTNQGAVGNDSDDFQEFYGASNAAIAREIVTRAIDDWEAVVTDANLSLNISAGTTNGRGETDIVQFSNGRPTSANITMDDNGGGFGWFFDTTPNDDAEFTALVNSGAAGTGPAFQASFFNTETEDFGYNDFYRTAVHEIGHALGLTNDSSAAIFSRLKTVVRVDNNQLALEQGGALKLYDGINLDAMFTGEHIFEGTSTPYQVYTDPPTSTFTVFGHGHDLMNAGHTVPADLPPDPSGETTRQWISDLDVRILADAYGYSFVLPSTLNTPHVTLDSQTGTLLVQGGVTTQAFGQNDTFDIDVIGSEIRVQVNNTVEKVPLSQVSQIVVARNGGQDTDLAFTLPSGIPYNVVQYVVSTNEDSANAGLADFIVDVNTVIPGAQIPLRAAIIETSTFGTGVERGIYVPRGTYKLTVTGTGGLTQGDFDISGATKVVGTGAGDTLIDASGFMTTTDRLFDIASGGSLELSRVTLTGGRAPNTALDHGGAIFVRDGGTLNLAESAIVDNRTTGSVANGGGIFFASGGGGTITNSVITGNHAMSHGGGVNLAQSASSSPAQVTLTRSVVVNNTAGDPGSATTLDVRAATGGQVNRTFTSGGLNQLGNATTGLGVNDDYIKQATTTVHYVVTGLGDTFSSAGDPNDAKVLSVREAVHKSNSAAGAQEIWLPAWKFKLTRESIRVVGVPDFKADIGDLDIHESLTVRGVTGWTNVAWRTGTVVDAVFDLIGDFNGDNVISDSGGVDNVDYVIWRDTQAGDLRADADDDGDVDMQDYNWWRAKFGNTLSLQGVT